MNPPAINLPPPRSWRDLPQPVKPRAMSREGRRRRIFALARTVGLTGVVLAACWGGMEMWATLQTNPGRLVAPADGTPVRGLVVRTDGTLDETWVRETLALPPQAALLALDLAALQHRLLGSGQVEVAELTRLLPDRLGVTLHERVPVGRILAQSGDSAPRTWLMARDGTVFAGVGLTPEALEQLPYLDGVRLKAAGTGLAPIEGATAAAVADLLAAARTGVPALARGFRVVSLAQFATNGVIVVKSAAVQEIIFDARESFPRQVELLDLALAKVAEARGPFGPAGPMASVNLAVGGSHNQVPVSLGLAVNGGTTSARRTLPAPTAADAYFPSPANLAQHDL